MEQLQFVPFFVVTYWKGMQRSRHSDTIVRHTNIYFVHYRLYSFHLLARSVWIDLHSEWKVG